LKEFIHADSTDNSISSRSLKKYPDICVFTSVIIKIRHDNEFSMEDFSPILGIAVMKHKNPTG
jgi:hypothetical protein